MAQRARRRRRNVVRRLAPVTPVANDTVDVWQVAQSAVVGMCPVPCGFGVTPVKAIPVALAAWQVVQPPAMPVWFICVPAKLVVDLWQVAQSAVVGMWPVPCGFGVTPVKAIPVALAAWHVVQPAADPDVVHHSRLERRGVGVADACRSGSSECDSPACHR